MDEQASAGLSPGRFVAAGLISACGDDKPGYGICVRFRVLFHSMAARSNCLRTLDLPTLFLIMAVISKKMLGTPVIVADGSVIRVMTGDRC
jgi:hypothetical protein